MLIINCFIFFFVKEILHRLKTRLSLKKKEIFSRNRNIFIYSHNIVLCITIFQLRELLDKIQQLPHLSNGHATAVHCQQNCQTPILYVTNSDGTTQQRPLSPSDVGSYKVRRTRGKLYMPLGLPSSRSKTKRWLSRSAPTTPSGTIPMSFLPGQSRRPSETDNNNQQAVPLLYEQDENEHNNADQSSSGVPLLTEQEEDQQAT